MQLAGRRTHFEFDYKNDGLEQNDCVNSRPHARDYKLEEDLAGDTSKLPMQKLYLTDPGVSLLWFDGHSTR